MNSINLMSNDKIKRKIKLLSQSANHNITNHLNDSDKKFRNDFNKSFKKLFKSNFNFFTRLTNKNFDSNRFSKNFLNLLVNDSKFETLSVDLQEKIGNNFKRLLKK